MAKTDLEHAAEFARDTLAAERNGWAPPHQAVKDLAEEFLKLVEAQRWRKWPEEVPEKQGSKYQFQVILDHYPAQALCISGRWFLDELRSDDDITDRVRWWRPIGELPKTEVGGVGDE